MAETGVRGWRRLGVAARRKRGWPVGAGGGRFGIVVISLVLDALLVAMIVGAFATDRAEARTEGSVRLFSAYQVATTAIAAETSLERQYRLEPGPVTLAAHATASQKVLQGLGEVRRLGGAQDRLFAATLAADQARYVAAVTLVFLAVDRHEPVVAVNLVDSRTVAPTLALMQNALSSAAAGHEGRVLRSVTDAKHAAGISLGLDVAVLIATMGLLTVAGLWLTRSRGRLQRQSDLNRHQALHDDLTGLPNRVLFQDRAAQALRAAQRSGTQTALLLVDVDRFKDVNDTLGHHYGDLLLEQIAQRFAATLRAGDSVARLGGDEFAVLLVDTNHADANAAASRLTDALREAFRIKDISLDVEASIGIALAGPDADVETALRHADIAMYEAKTQHQQSATYELARDDNTIARLALLGDLRRAITHGELILHYQPKVSTMTGALHSVEALVRWQHPTRGLIMPDEFIPVAEGTALIHPLTDEILRQALTQARAWRDRGWIIPVSVNISARSLHDLAFPSRVQQMLDTIGVPASGLTLELTEGAIMTDPQRAIAALRNLSAMGITLSIDDYGTGYSSMAYLKDLPVRELKIDRSFVIAMSHDDGDHVLVQSAVDLGHNLGLHVVAEGVEDVATQDALTTMGCDLVQGYYIARPATATDLDPWLRIHAPTTDPSSGTFPPQPPPAVDQIVEPRT